jgi:hypothetical protein
MKPGHWFALGSAIAACTAAIGFYLVAKGPATEVPGPKTAGKPRWQPTSTGKRQVLATDAPGRAQTPARSTPDHSTNPASATPTFRVHGKPPANRIADEREWFARAERVERQANHELATLRETLDLDPTQQQRVFNILARNSPSWLPGMATGGSHGVGIIAEESVPANQIRPGLTQPTRSTADSVEHRPVTAVAPPSSPGSVTEEILPLLDSDQQQALLAAELERRAWWEEVLPQLLPPEFPAAAGSEDHATLLPGGGDTKAYEGPTELLEE